MRDRSDKSLERRLKRIERWLKRCVTACRCGSWSSALMEIECMEAEARGFRDDLWRTVEADAKGYPARSWVSRICFAARVAAVSLLFVMAVGLPLSVDQDRPFQPFQPFGVESVALLTSTESEILNALRQSLSSANAGRVLLSVEIPEARSEMTAAQGVAAAEEARTEDTSAVPPVMRSPAPARPRVEVLTAETVAETPQRRKGPSVEEVLSLIQVGERALRISEPAVKGIP